MDKNIVHLRDVLYSYEENEAPAVDHVSLDVAEGEFLAVLGRNGSGKSTLARLLNALLMPESGEIISGSIQIPNWMPSALILSANCFKPPGSFFWFTNQSPKLLSSLSR